MQLDWCVDSLSRYRSPLQPAHQNSHYHEAHITRNLHIIHLRGAYTWAARLAGRRRHPLTNHLFLLSISFPFMMSMLLLGKTMVWYGPCRDIGNWAAGSIARMRELQNRTARGER